MIENEIQGPVWTNGCPHGGYVGSYEYHDGQYDTYKYDVYVVNEPMTKTQSVCIRFGNGADQYHSPGSLVNFICFSYTNPEFDAARRLLIERGTFVWYEGDCFKYDASRDNIVMRSTCAYWMLPNMTRNHMDDAVAVRNGIDKQGYGLMREAGNKYSIHDVSDAAKLDEQRTNEVISRNTDLEAFMVSVIDEAHRYTRDNKRYVETSINGVWCGYCGAFHRREEVADYVNKDSTTAKCPSCGIDAVLPSSVVPYAIHEAFREEFRKRWFDPRK